MSHQTHTDQHGFIRTTIDFSGHFDLGWTIEFANSLYALPGSHEYILDFRNTKWVSPFGMLYLASHLRHIRKNTTASMFVTNHEHLTYQAHMGFFQSFGLDFGKLPGQAKGNANYVPVTITPVMTFGVPLKKWTFFLGGLVNS